ncbi:MAG: hydrogenase maturation protease [Acidobacteriia bacterium]|nr:hydrogenase maturation protease [Terriglobia bacterium]
MKTLLLGMGNPILSDDSVGVRLAGDLSLELTGTPNLDVVEECSVGGLSLLDVITGYDRLIVLDAIRTAGGSPGDWYRFDARALRETQNLRNVHDVNFATALELGRRLGHHLPPDHEIHVFAVEVADDATFGESLSPALEAAYPAIVSGILEEVRALLPP